MGEILFSIGQSFITREGSRHSIAKRSISREFVFFNVNSPQFQKFIYEFPIAALRNHHNLFMVFILLQRIFWYLLLYCGIYSLIVVEILSPKIKVLAGLLLLEALRDNPFPCHFQTLEASLIPLVHDSTSNCLFILCFHHLPLTLTFPPSSFKDPCD